MIDEHLKDTKVRSNITRPRLGFLGVGWIGLNRMQAIAAANIADIVAVADLFEENRKKAVEALPDVIALASTEDLFDHDLDGIVIATPSALHAEQSIQMLERGYAVFCQKPLGRNAAETRRVVEAAEKADKLLGVDLSYRYTAAMQSLERIIKNGELGEIYAVNLVFHNAYGPDKAWFYDPMLAGGGCVIDLGIHLIDLALWMLNFPGVQQVTSSLYSKGKPLVDRFTAVEDYATAQIRLDNGTTLQLACSWHLPAGVDAMIEASFYGTQGGAAFRNINGSFYDFTAERFNGTERQMLTQPPDQWGGRAAVDWVQRLAEGAAFDPEARRLIEVAGVLDAIYESVV